MTRSVIRARGVRASCTPGSREESESPPPICGEQHGYTSKLTVRARIRRVGQRCDGEAPALVAKGAASALIRRRQAATSHCADRAHIGHADDVLARRSQDPAQEPTAR